MERSGHRGRSRLGSAMLVSALLHGAAAVLFWVAASRAAELPEMRVYSVNIVSPPPQEAGEPAPEVAAPEPVTDPEPTEPEPEPPVEPEPAPPEPSPPERPTREVAPEPEPVEPEPEPAEEETDDPPPAPDEPEPSRGAQPSAEAEGGEGLNVRIEGVQFSDPAYLENIIRQVNRYFRPPSGSRTDVAEVIFWINRDGSVSDIEVGRSSGSFQFRLAAMSAVEQAGLNRAFGPLPDSYPADRLPVTFEFRPAR